MSDNGEEKLTGFDLWTPNDYSNFITISAAAIGSTLLVLFKSRCSKISLCFGLWSCDREVKDDDEDDNTNKSVAQQTTNTPQPNPQPNENGVNGVNGADNP